MSLCILVSSIPFSQYGNMSSIDGEEYTKKEKGFLQRLDAFFDAHGLQPVGKRMAYAYVRMMASDVDGTFARVQPWLLNQLNGVRKLPEGFSPWQKGCPGLIPGLRSMPFWETPEVRAEWLPWCSALEDSFEAIKAELLTLRGQNAFRPYRAPSSRTATAAEDGVGSVSHDAGEWNVFYIFLHNMDFEENRVRCPVTCAAIEAIGAQYHHAFFSALAPGTHITKHHGPTNKKLRCHLPLIVPEGKCRLRAGGEVRTLEEGKCLVFDDSFEHEAWNDDPDATRIVLIFDVWHPDLRMKEVKFLDYLQRAALKAERKAVQIRDAAREDADDDATSTPELVEKKTPGDGEAVEHRIYDNFFTVIQAAQKITASDDAVFL